MASIPARPASQRRTSPEQEQSATPTQQVPTPIRTRSEDSQTILVQTEEVTREDLGSTEETSHNPTTTAYLDEGDKKCWICFSDASEDTPETSPWRDPCPCALVAHEECLLDWIADKESPTNARNRNAADSKIECPQCKAEIKLARPRDYVVDLVRGVERLGARMVVPGAALTLSGIIYQSSMAWGVHSVYAIFGVEDGFKILKPLLYNATRAPIEVYAGSPREAANQLLGTIVDHLVHWRLYVGLPLVTPILILSRTSVADGLLPVLPIVFFASQTQLSAEPINFADWPPSASFAFAVLPYVRAMYNALYKTLFAEKKARWLKEIQPRSTQNPNDNANEGMADDGENFMNVPAADDDENIFEVRIDGGIWEEWDDNGPAAQDRPANAPDNNNNNIDHDNNDDDGPAPAPDVPRHAHQAEPAGQQPAAAAAGNGNNANANANANAGERRLAFSPTLIAENIIGALLFPTIAGLAGEALKLALPRAWTAAPTVSRRFGAKLAARGLLQHKWGRSLVGGCLFVVAKDALVLYVRWKMAQMHRSRRVVDYDRTAGQKARV